MRILKGASIIPGGRDAPAPGREAPGETRRQLCQWQVKWFDNVSLWFHRPGGGAGCLCASNRHSRRRLPHVAGGRGGSLRIDRRRERAQGGKGAAATARHLIRPALTRPPAQLSGGFFIRPRRCGILLLSCARSRRRPKPLRPCAFLCAQMRVLRFLFRNRVGRYGQSLRGGFDPRIERVATSFGRAQFSLAAARPRCSTSANGKPSCARWTGSACSARRNGRWNAIPPPCRRARHGCCAITG